MDLCGLRLFLRIYIILFAFCPYVKTETSSGPGIVLESYRKVNGEEVTEASKSFRTSTEFNDGTIEKNGADYVVNDVDVVIFLCEAPYPVEWTVPDIQQFEDMDGFYFNTESVRISEFLDASKPEPENKRFKTYLHVVRFEPKFFSVRFSCSASNSSEISSPIESSIHIYMLGNFLLGNQGKTVTVHYTENERNNGAHSNPVVIPCRPAKPDLKVILERKEDASWKEVSSGYYSFDPKIGFTFPVQELPGGTSVLGLYRCRIHGHDPGDVDATSVTFSVETHVPVKVEPFHTVLKEKAKVVVGDVIKCCTGVDHVRPQVSFLECFGGALQCEIAGEVFLPKYPLQVKQETTKMMIDEEESDCIRAWDTWHSVIGCHGDNIEFLGEIVKTFRPQAGSISWRKEEWKKASPTTPQISLMKYTDVRKERNVSVEEKMIMLVGHAETKNLPNNSTAFFFPLASRLVDMASVDNWTKEEDIVEYGRNVYYEGEPLRIICFGLKYFYGYGSHLKVNWKNGTSSILKRDEIAVLRRIHFFGTAAQFDSFNIVAEFGRELVASLEMESVDCFLPRTSGPKWDKLRYSLSVLHKGSKSI